MGRTTGRGGFEGVAASLDAAPRDGLQLCLAGGDLVAVVVNLSKAGGGEGLDGAVEDACLEHSHWLGERVQRPKLDALLDKLEDLERGRRRHKAYRSQQHARKREHSCWSAG